MCTFSRYLSTRCVDIQCGLNSVDANSNGTARFEKCKQLFEYQHLLLLGDIWWSKF